MSVLYSVKESKMLSAIIVLDKILYSFIRMIKRLDPRIN